MNNIKFKQHNGQVLPERADWDMGGAWVVLPNKQRRYIMPGDWLIEENDIYIEVMSNADFLKQYSVETIIKPKTTNKMSENTTGQELSFGQKAVGITFNPGGHPLVNAFKEKYAELIDALNTAKEASANPEVKRQLSIAITEAQTSQMWAVKAATWQY